MEIAFLTFICLSLYSYLLFPVILAVSSRVIKRPWSKGIIRPTISMIISVYNEEKVIAAKIENTLVLDYPSEKLEIMVVSDGSTDSTEQIVSNFSSRDSRIVLKDFRERSGKTACLNLAVPEASGDIIFFTDANSMFPKDILAKLVSNFADASVGLVTGWTKYGDFAVGEDTTGLYSRFEKWSKLQESIISSCVGADGAIFAMRKELYRTLQEYDINDFVIPLNVIRQGKRVVLDRDVYCFERPSNEAGKEYRRQVRITTRTLGAIRRNLEFLDPFHYGSFAFFLISHKIMRFLVPFFLIATFGINLILIAQSPVYRVTFLGQLALLAVGVSSLLGFITGRVGDIVKLLAVTLLAQLGAWYRTFTGVSDTMWTPQR